MNVNLNRDKFSIVNSIALLVMGVLALTMLSSFAHATEVAAEAQVTSVGGRALISTVDSNGVVQVNCNSLNKYERFKCYEDLAKRKREAMQNKEVKSEDESRQVMPKPRNLGQEIKEQCAGKQGKERVLCIDEQIIEKKLAKINMRKSVMSMPISDLDALSAQSEFEFRNKVMLKFGSEENAKEEFKKLREAYKEKESKLKELHEKIAELRLKAKLTTEEKAEFAAKLDAAFVKSIDARIDIAKQLETQGADSSKVAAIITKLQDAQVKYKAAATPADKKLVVMETNDAWQAFRIELGNTFFTGQVEMHAFKIKAVLEKADAATAQLKTDGKDVSKLGTISLRANEHIEAALGSGITLKNAAWHLARARVWTNYYMHSINRIANGKSLDAVPSDESAPVSSSVESEVEVNTGENEDEQAAVDSSESNDDSKDQNIETENNSQEVPPVVEDSNSTELNEVEDNE